MDGAVDNQIVYAALEQLAAKPAGITWGKDQMQEACFDDLRVWPVGRTLPKQRKESSL
jgi:hypothetical protein